MVQRLPHAAMTRLCVCGMWSVLLLLLDCILLFFYYFILFQKQKSLYSLFYSLARAVHAGECSQGHIVSSSFASNASLVHMLSKFSAIAIDPMIQLRTFMSPTMCDRIREGFKATIAPSEDELRILAPSLSMFDCQLNPSVVVRFLEIVEVNLAYGIPEGWFGKTNADMMIRVRFECLPQLPSITWSNVGWFTRELSQFRSHRRIAQVMARVGKEQQVKDVENRSIANFKQESLEQGLILHPLLLR
jgi:hypothetical protein